ncbi:unnamed protein product [Discula destructiva]
MEADYRDLLVTPSQQPSSIENVLSMQPEYTTPPPNQPQDDFIDDDSDDENYLEQGSMGNPDDVVAGDDDSDDERLLADIRKLDRDVAAFKASMMDSDSDPEANVDPLLKSRKRPRAQGAGRKKRKVGGGGTGVEPSIEVKIALSKASDALMDRDLDEALSTVEEVIRQNAETYDAWMLLSTIHQERGQTGEAIKAMCFAAHLRPRDFHGWMACAQFALSDDTEGARENNVDVAQLCYSAAIRANPKSLKARMGMANCALEAGASSVAAAAYNRVLQRRPYNMQALRNLAEAAFDTRSARRQVEKASIHYETVIAHVRRGGQLKRGTFEWSDVMIYVEMLSFLERYADAARALRSLARFMIGRQDETFWDAYIDDDREWDLDEDRKREVEQYVPNRYPYGLYGPALPLDLRAKLAMYRLKLGQNGEAMRHLDAWIPLTGPSSTQIHEYFEDSPFVIKELANQLYENKLAQRALDFYDFYDRLQFGQVDAEVLIQRGRCYIDLRDRTAAEDLFIQALEADDDNIEARYELAQLYEMNQEKEEAFVLVNEALRLAHDLEEEDKLDDDWNADLVEDIDPAEAKALQRRRIRRKIMREKRAGQRPKRGRRQYVRRMVGRGKRELYEQKVTESFRTQYQKVQELRARVADGDLEAEDEWMTAAGHLVDDFRSFKEFYPWDKYLSYMGYGSFFKENKRKPDPVQLGGQQGREETGAPQETRGTGEDAQAETAGPQGQGELTAMAERLQKNLAPREDDEGTAEPVLRQHDHRGIPFDQWLDLFLEYAISLARKQRAEEAYIVCQSARDSIVYKSTDNNFLIHVAWAACAIYAADEETCVAVARFFMRFCHASTDSYRIFSALCRTCQSPVSWYASGPAQKYILRQIKAMDRTLLPADLAQEAMSVWDTAVPRDEPNAVRHENIDVTLLMMYGHILLTSTSYTYALNYFLRAAALDPDNPMVNLSTGIAYVHYAMKRQAENRQFIIAQGMHYMFAYYDARRASADVTERLEAHYNVARCYHLLGIFHLAAEFYARVLAEAAAWRRWREACEEKAGPMRAFVYESAVNMRTYSLTNGDFGTARAITEQWLVL